MFFSYLKRVLGNVFQLSETSINSYDISFMYKLPCYTCNIVECGIKHHQPNFLFTKTYTYLPTRLHALCKMMFYSFLNNTTSVISRAGTVYLSCPLFGYFDVVLFSYTNFPFKVLFIKLF